MHGRSILAGMLALVAATAASAHIGSPNVFYDGVAGPYPVRVIVKTPGVVPGLAEITVRCGDPDVRRVTVRPVHFQASLEGAPPADLAEPVRGDDSLYSAELWLMTSGSYSVYVELSGERGTGTAIVPVQSIATRRLDMPAWLGGVLAALGILLVAGLVRLTGAAVESILPPGEDFGAASRRRARVVMAVALAVVGAVLYGGKTWWDSVDADYVNRMWRAYSFTPSVEVRDGWRVVELELDDERWQRSARIAPDHGKLMHMFLIREGDLDAFAHVHPVRTGDWTFGLAVPPLPAGRYRIYADVTHESGFVQTLTDVVELPAPVEGASPPSGLEPDPDDSWRVADVQDERRHTFDDGSVLVWELDGAIRTGEETTLRFAFRRPDGGPGALEPYMGMMSHAALRRDDGSVFIHLHPTGTISMAAQELFARRGASSGGDAEAPPMDHAAMGHSIDGMEPQAVSTVTMPYQFPRQGTYRIWVQVKSAGRVYTGVFQTDVEASAG